MIPPRIQAKIEAAKYKHLKELDLSWRSTHYELTEIPLDIFELEHLEILNLRNNKIKEIPEQIFKLKKLEHLDLIGNQIDLSNIRLAIVQLPNLKFLKLTWDINKTLPHWFNDITNLGLDISTNQLTKIPEDIANLKNINFLSLWWNLSEPLPPRLDFLEQLKLDISGNQLTNLPESLGLLANLTELDLSYNQLTELPDFVTQLTKLTELDLSYNQLTKLPKTIGNLTNLVRLNLSVNRLKKLPNSISNLTQLTELYLSENKLKTLPDTIGNLTNLKRLDLSENKLAPLPQSITKFTQLTWIDLCNNRLTSLPKSITKLNKLTKINLISVDRLTSLPESLSNFANLIQLYSSNNQIVSIPESFKMIINKLELKEVDEIISEKIINYGAREQYLVRANLTGADLTKADFSGSNLTEANLNQADFTQTNLSNTNLTRVRAIATDFTGANFTGACIENWQIDRETIFDDVICNYIYLKSEIDPDTGDTIFSDRRPQNTLSNFEPGEFINLIQKARKSIDLIFKNGIDWKAFLETLKELQIKYQDDRLSIGAIEHKLERTFIVSLNVTPEADRAVIETQAQQIYETKLQVIEAQYKAELRQLETKCQIEITDKDREIIDLHKQQSADILQLVKLAANQPITVAAEAAIPDRIDLDPFTKPETKTDRKTKTEIFASDRLTIKEPIEQIKSLLTSSEYNLQPIQRRKLLFEIKQLADFVAKIEDKKVK